MKKAENNLRVMAKITRVKVKQELSGLDIYDINGIEGQEFDVIAIDKHTYDDGSGALIAVLDTPTGLREIALAGLGK